VSPTLALVSKPQYHSEYMIRKIFFLVILPLIAKSGGNPTFLNQGGFSFRIGQQYMQADQYFDNDGEKQNTYDYSTAVTFLQAQYGATENLNIGIYIPAIVQASADLAFSDTTLQTRSNSSTGDFELSAKYRVWYSPKSTVLITGRIVLPTGEDDEKYNLNTGYGTFGEAAGAEYIYRHNQKLYAQAYAGFLNRSNDFSDEVFAGGDIGYRLLDELVAVFQCRAINPLENGDDRKRGGIPGLAANNSGYIKLGVELDVAVSPRIDIYGRMLYPVKGQFVQAAALFEGGLSFLFEKRNAE
jgi:protein XagA